MCGSSGPLWWVDRIDGGRAQRSIALVCADDLPDERVDVAALAARSSVAPPAR